MEPTHIFDRERVQRQGTVIRAAMNLFAVSGASSFLLRIPNTEPRLYVMAGTADEIRQLLDKTEDALLDPCR